MEFSTQLLDEMFMREPVPTPRREYKDQMLDAFQMLQHWHMQRALSQDVVSAAFRPPSDDRGYFTLPLTAKQHAQNGFGAQPSLN